MLATSAEKKLIFRSYPIALITGPVLYSEFDQGFQVLETNAQASKYIRRKGFLGANLLKELHGKRGSAPYKPGKVETDFRYKLTSLKPNDRMYYVIAETEAKKRFILGEIVLTSALTSSPFADKLYFVQHHLDMRKTTFANSIVNP